LIEIVNEVPTLIQSATVASFFKNFIHMTISTQYITKEIIAINDKVNEYIFPLLEYLNKLYFLYV
jgi:hypothetical protein